MLYQIICIITLFVAKSAHILFFFNVIIYPIMRKESHTQPFGGLNCGVFLAPGTKKVVLILNSGVVLIVGLLYKT